MRKANLRRCSERIDLKYGLILFSMSVVLSTAGLVNAADQDNPELGIEMKKGQVSLSVADALDKSKTKLNRYQKAKENAAQIFTGVPEEPGAVAPSQTHQPPKQDAKSISGSRLILLKNGQAIGGVIRERDKNGLWVEGEPGVKLYFEINENFGQMTQELLEMKGFNNIVLRKDLNGKDRMIRAEKVGHTI